MIFKPAALPSDYHSPVRIFLIKSYMENGFHMKAQRQPRTFLKQTGYLCKIMLKTANCNNTMRLSGKTNNLLS
jgi:hypothetical protein